MKKVTQEPEVLLAQSRWEFFGRLFNALRSGGRRIAEASLQGAAEQQVEAVRGQGAEELLAAGWQRSWPPTPEPSRVFEVMHALELRNVSGAALDLHRQMLEDNRAPGMDQGAWKRARRMTVEGAEVRVPSPEDLLVMVCVHGLRATPTRTIRWVLDVLAIIEAFGGELEWDVVLRIARRRKVTLAMAESLEFVRNEFGAGVPESTLAALRGAKRGWVERVDYRAQGRKERATWAVASTFTRYLRQADGNGMVAGVRKGPGFLRALWGLERTRDIPLDGWRRVQAMRARRSYWRERRERELKTG